ncbi:MAG: hypothetical protein H7Y09_15370 [Chitinophagaceae bacterium]|nr:hypothetical protein [Anaerolineae bacterium]
MEKWEYLTKFCEASARSKETKRFIKENFAVKKPPVYTPEAMIPELNALGEDGWELIHMEPVPKVGKKGDILFNSGFRWSNVYFCVFKRLKKPAEIPAEPQPVAAQMAPPDRPILPPSED